MSAASEDVSPFQNELYAVEPELGCAAGIFRLEKSAEESLKYTLKQTFL